MGTVNLADAMAHLSELVDRVQAGDTIAIARRGKTITRSLENICATPIFSLLCPMSTPRGP